MINRCPSDPRGLSNEELCLRCSALIDKLVSRCGCRKNDRLEAHQEAWLALLRSRRRWDPSRGVSFCTWAWSCVRSSLWQWTWARSGGIASASPRTRYTRHNEGRPIEDVAGNFDVEGLAAEPPIDNQLGDDAVRLFCSELNHRLNEKERQLVVDYWVGGLDHCDLLKKYGAYKVRLRLSDEVVQTAIGVVRNKLGG